jgi:hypothetical protein
MGKPMGQHPHTHYIILNPKKGPKRGRDPTISIHLVLHLRQPVEVPKLGQT